MGYTSPTLALLVKDFKLTARRWYELASLTIVAAVLAMASSYSVSGPSSLAIQSETVAVVLSSGQLATAFITAIAAGYIAVLREAEKGTLDGIRSSPVSPEAVYVAKLIYIYVITLLISLTYTVASALLSGYYNVVSTVYIESLMAVTLYFSAAAALTSFMIVYSEVRGLLSIIVLAGLITPYIQDASQQLALAAACAASHADAIKLVIIAVTFASIATVLSKPLSEI